MLGNLNKNFRSKQNNTDNQTKTISLKKINEKYEKTKKRLLLWIFICFSILIGLVIYASFRVGGIQNLLLGDSDPFTNTVTNVGTIITNLDTTPTPVPTEFTIELPEQSLDEITLARNQNSLVITNFTEQTLRIRKDTYVMITNQTGKIIGLQFSDGRLLRFEQNQQQNILFSRAGTITYKDVIDNRYNTISGTIIVEE
jgi:hypothetical protein